jgi:hypothetical protein
MSDWDSILKETSHVSIFGSSGKHWASQAISYFLIKKIRHKTTLQQDKYYITVLKQNKWLWIDLSLIHQVFCV